jgi:nickel-dependent lactate racemase
MRAIDLRYGRTSIPIRFDEAAFDILKGRDSGPPLTDAEINQKLDESVGTPSIEHIVTPGETVLIVVPDATRQTACGQIVNLLVRRLIANGTAAFDIRIIFATGIHRKVTDDEKSAILTPFIAQRIKTLDHDARDLARLVRLGETTGGIPIGLNRALLEHDHVIIVGGVSFHYFAGFTGGRKLICPGLASAGTIAKTHALAFDCESKARRAGVDTSLLVGNAINEAFVEISQRINPAFSVNTRVDDEARATDVFCGDWREAHAFACEAYAADNRIEITEKRALVVVSCGGYPHDINLIQAHKALDAAARATLDGGTIALVADCEDGLGRDDFLKWFEAADSRALAEMLCEKYQVNGQTAWSLLTKTERFEVLMVTELDGGECEKMHIKRIEAGDLADLVQNSSSGYIMPAGSKIHIAAQTT